MTDTDHPYTPSLDEGREAFAAGLGILPPFYDPAHERVLEHRRGLFDRMIEAVRAKEREKAARIAEGITVRGADNRVIHATSARNKIARAIRAQGKEQGRG